MVHPTSSQCFVLAMFPEGINRLAVSVSSLTWFIRYSYVWALLGKTYWLSVRHESLYILLILHLKMEIAKELIFCTNLMYKEGKLLGKYLIRNQYGRVAATSMACYQRFWIWTSVSGRWFEIFSLMCSNPAQARCIRYNIMWSSLSVTYGKSMVFCGYSGFLSQ